jgi:hypothetical protein
MAIQDMLASKLVKMVAVYQSPSRTLLALDLYDCPGGNFPIMAGDLNANHVDWKSRAITP